MKKSVAVFLLCALMLQVCAGFAVAQAAAQPNGAITRTAAQSPAIKSDYVEFMKDRLRLNLPKGTSKISQNIGGIMGTTNSVLQNDYARYVDGDEQFSVVTTETFCFSSGDLKRDMGFLLGDGAALSAYTIVPSPADRLMLQPKEVKDQPEAGILLALVKHEDNSLIFVNFIVNETARKNVKKYTDISVDAALSAVSGARKLTPGGEAKLGNYKISLPPKYVVSEREGADYSVYDFSKLVDSKDFYSQPEVMIYLGSHPNPLPEVKTPKYKTLKIKGVNRDFLLGSNPNNPSEKYAQAVFSLSMTTSTDITAKYYNDDQWSEIAQMLQSLK